MKKACSMCGKIHDYGYKCTHNKRKYAYRGGEERELRNTHAWHKKSLEIRKKAQRLCEVCRANGRYVYEGLEVHHIAKLKDNPEKLLDNLNLVCLCVTCHKQADKGEIPADYLSELAFLRENG